LGNVIGQGKSRDAHSPFYEAMAVKQSPLLVVTYGLDRWPSARFEGLEIRVVEATCAEQALSCLYGEDVSVLVLGSNLSPHQGKEFLARWTLAAPDIHTSNIVLCASSEAVLFQEFIDESKLFYMARSAISDDQLFALVRAAADQERFFLNVVENERLSQRVVADDRLIEICTRLDLQSDTLCVAGLVSDTAQSLTNASCAHCFIYNSAEETLLEARPAHDDQRGESAATGLIGFVARTGERIDLERADRDPRYDPSVDNPSGIRDPKLIAEPIRLGPGEILGVVAAFRAGHDSSFSRSDVENLALISACSAPRLKHILLQSRIQELLLDPSRGLRGKHDIFRVEALEYHVRKWDQEGDVLRTAPAWLRRSHWFLLIILMLAVAFMSFANLNEYAAGPAIIRARESVKIASPGASLVRSVKVLVGDRVHQGDLLVEFDLSSHGAKDASGGQLRAPLEGVVSDVWVRPGQLMNPGDPAMNIIDGDAGYELIALLPGSYAPQLQPGLQIQFKVDGYPDSNEKVQVDRVGAEIVGPIQAARAFGRDGPEALMGGGPVVIVRALLKQPTFRANHREYGYEDGLAARAQVTVRSERMIVGLVPAFRGVLN
jgi:hypothetical protein